MGNLIKRHSENTKAISHQVPPEKAPRIAFGERLTRNVLIASLALACVISARDISLSRGQTVLSSLQNAVESEWDTNIGRLVYANSTISEAVSVFAAGAATAIYQPCFSQVTDVFSDDAPYIRYAPCDTVYTAAACEITSVTYAPDSQTYAVRAHCENGLDCLYFGLSACFAKEGDVLPARAQIGVCDKTELVFEVRRNGAAIDASEYFISEQVQ